MKKMLAKALALTVLLPLTVSAATLIECKKSEQKNSITSIWPTPYLSDSGLLCFDVKGWPEFSGKIALLTAKALAGQA